MTSLASWLQENEEPFKSKARLNSLYSDFTPLKSSNPDGFAANVSAWRAALLHAARAGLAPGSGVLTIRTGDKLAAELQTKTLGRPLALDAVLEESTIAKETYPLNTFLSTKQSIYTKRWAPALEDVAIHLLSYLGYARDNRAAPGKDFVLVPLVEEAADKVIAQVCKESATHSDLIYTLETFSTAFAEVLSPSILLSGSDISVLLAHLYRDRKAMDMKLDAKAGTTVIKFSRNPPVLPDAVSPNDCTIAVLHTLAASLTQQTAAIEARSAALLATAKTALAEGRKDRARQALRLRKLAETTLRKREDALLQVSSVLESIDDAIQNKQTVNALERSSAVLHDINEQIGGAERVERVMEGLNEGMADVEEVSGVLGALGAEAVDEDELEEEMQRMEKERVDALPTAPSAEPEPEGKKTDEGELADLSVSMGSLALDKNRPEPEKQKEEVAA